MAFNATIAGSGDNKFDVYGATDVSIASITFGGADTYVTNGLALTAAQFGLPRPILGIVFLGGNTAGIVTGLYWNTQTQKLQMLGAGGGVAGTVAFAELANGTSIANFAFTVLVITSR